QSHSRQHSAWCHQWLSENYQTMQSRPRPCCLRVSNRPAVNLVSLRCRRDADSFVVLSTQTAEPKRRHFEHQSRMCQLVLTSRRQHSAEGPEMSPLPEVN